MIINDVLLTLQDIIAIDNDISDLCLLKFQKRHTVYLGSNPQNPPQSFNYPLIIIDSVSDKLQLQTRVETKIEIGIMIKDDSQNISDNKVTMNGFVIVEQLRELCMIAILNNIKRLKAKIGFIECGTVANNIYPIFISKMTILLEQRLVHNTIVSSI